MTPRALPALGLMLAVPCAASAAASGPLDGVALAQLSTRERIVIRILPPARPASPPPPARRAAPPAPPAPIQYRERSAPRCVAANVLAAASITRDGDVDLVATDGRRLRAKLNDDCPTLNFYRGFYLKRAADGMVCARRDALRSRSGARCGISRFRTLVPRE